MALQGVWKMRIPCPNRRPPARIAPVCLVVAHPFFVLSKDIQGQRNPLEKDVRKGRKVFCPCVRAGAFHPQFVAWFANSQEVTLLRHSVNPLKTRERSKKSRPLAENPVKAG